MLQMFGILLCHMCRGLQDISFDAFARALRRVRLENVNLGIRECAKGGGRLLLARKTVT